MTAIIPENSDASAGQCSGTGMGYRATQWKPHAPSVGGGGGGGSCFIIGTSVTGDGWRETLIMSPDPGLHIVPHLSVQWHCRRRRRTTCRRMPLDDLFFRNFRGNKHHVVESECVGGE